jgi:peptidoglycan/LPS O-acetylase OafA/YrhL
MLPWPSAYTLLDRKSVNADPLRVIVRKARVIQGGADDAPGTISEVSGKGIDVATGQGRIRIIELQRAGKSALSVEAFFYLCFPFLLAWVYKAGTKPLIIFTVIIWIVTQVVLLDQLNSSSYAPKSLLHDFIYYNPLMHLNSFLAGILCGIYLKRNPDSYENQKNNTFLVLLSLGIIFILIWSRPYLEELLGMKLAFTNGLLAPAFLLFIVLLARNESRISKILSYSGLVLLGEASYSLYILQKPVHGIYDKIIVPRLELSETMHFYVFLFILIIVSILSYKIFETPMRKVIRKRFS